MPPTDEDAEGIARSAQREALHEAASADAELQEAYDATSLEIRTRLKADPDNVNHVRPVVREAYQKTSFKRRKVIARVIESGAAKGAKLSLIHISEPTRRS